MTFRPTSKSELQTAVSSWCNSQNNGIHQYFALYNDASYTTAHAWPSPGHGQNIPPYAVGWHSDSDTTTNMTYMTSTNSDASRQSTPAGQWYNNTTAKCVSIQVVVSTNSYIRFKYDISSEGVDILQVALRKLNPTNNEYDAVSSTNFSGGNPNIGYYDSGNLFTIYGAGTYRVEISFRKDSSVSHYRDNAIISEFRWIGYPHISTWDTSLITDMSNLFKDKTSFNDDIGNWNTSLVRNMWNMFRSAYAFNQDIGAWYTSNVTNMVSMFSDAISFNNNGFNFGNWDTSNVTNMSSMFSGTSVFNQDIGRWQTQNVTNMSYMFNSASVFNQDIGGWQTQNVTDMNAMFRNAYAFNQNIGSWTVSNVNNMNSMFGWAYAFNQNISAWDVSNVTDMGSMFWFATDFNNNDSESIGNWNTRNVTNMAGMFGMIAFDREIRYWYVSNVTQFAEMFTGNTAFYARFGQETGYNNGYNGSPTAAFFSLFRPSSNQALVDAVNVWRTDPIIWNNNITPTYPWTVTPAAGVNYISEMSSTNHANNTASTIQITVNSISQFNVSFNYDVSSENSYDYFLFSKSGVEVLKKYGTNNTVYPNPPITSQNTTGVYNDNFGAGIYVFEFKYSKDVSNSRGRDNVIISNLSITGVTDFPLVKHISNWDTSLITNMNQLFKNKTTFNDDIGGWDTSNVEEMYEMFYGASAFNKEVRSWDVSNNYNMYQIFVNATAFIAEYTNEFGFNGGYPDTSFWSFAPQTKGELVTAVNEWCKSSSDSSKNSDAYFGRDITIWNTSFITDMSNLFNGKTTFNDDIGNWNTSIVTNMTAMFANTVIFNQDIRTKTVVPGNGTGNYTAWNTSNVTNMGAMFSSALAFNRNIGNWNTSKVARMNSMFSSTNSFNQDIGNWDVSSVEVSSDMFNGNTAFNKDIGNWKWDPAKLTTMGQMFIQATAFNQDIRYWNVGSNVIVSNMFLGASAFSTDYSGSIGYSTTPSSTFFNQFTDNGVTYYFTEDSNNAVTITSAVSSTGSPVTIVDITIPSSFTVAGVVHTIRHIGNDAFYNNNNNITSTGTLTIPASVTSIGTQSFRGTGFHTVTFAEGSGLLTIGNSAFESTAFTSITIPASVTEFGGAAFASCTSLTSVIFATGSGLLTIGQGAFYQTGLTSIVIPASVTEIGGTAFAWCASLTSVIFAAGSLLETIETAAFEESGITSIVIPASVTTIGASAFKSCSNLASVTFIASNNSEAGIILGDDLFQNTNVAKVFIMSGQNLTYSGNKEEYYVGTDYSYNLGWNTGYMRFYTYVIAGSGVFNKINYTNAGSPPYTVLMGWTSIGSQAFQETALTSIEIPASVTEIGEKAFFYATSLASVSFAAGSVLETIGNNAFQNTAIASIIIPASVTSIGRNAFTHVTPLTSVTFATGSVLETIGNSAFQSTRFTSIEIPASVTSIGGYAFYGVISLASVTFAAGSVLNSIGMYAFNDAAFTSIIIPASVTSIGGYAFNHVTPLTSVLFIATTASVTIDSTAFNACDNLTNVFIKAIIFPDSPTNNRTISLTDFTNNSTTLTTDGDVFWFYSIDNGTTFDPGSSNFTFTLADNTTSYAAGDIEVFATYGANSTPGDHNDTPIVTNSSEIIIDTTRPVINNTNVKVLINNGENELGYVTADKTVTWSIYTSNSDSGVSILPTTATTSNGNLTLDNAANYETKNSYSFYVKAVDIAGNETSTAIVVSVNTPTTATIDISGDVEEGATVDAVVQNAYDPQEIDDSYQYQWQSSTDGTNFDDITNETTSSYQIPPDQSMVNKYLRVRVTIKDGVNDITVLYSSSEEVANVNDAPVFDTDPITTINEDSEYTYNITVSDEDGQIHVITAPTKPSWITLTDNEDNTATLTGTPLQADNGDNAVTIVASDELSTNGALTEQAFNIHVTNVNDDPSGTVTITGTVRVNEELTVDVSNLQDDDGLGSISHQWKRVDVNGTIIATTPAYTLVNADVGYVIVVTISYIDGGGNTESIDVSTSNQVGVFKPDTKTRLQTAVDAWNSDSISATSTYGSISGWDTSDITDMSELFKDTTFNDNIGNWNTSNVQNMENMFDHAIAFDQDIGNWNTSNVTTMKNMFKSTPFNQDIGPKLNTTMNGSNYTAWDTSNVETMESMFQDAVLFNQDLSGWDTSNVETMESMFQDAVLFDQDLSGWDTSRITSTGRTKRFYGATNFDREIENLNITKIGESEFENSGVTGPIYIPAGVTSIGDNAFKGINLSSNSTISIPSGASIGSDAFANITSSVDITVTVTGQSAEGLNLWKTIHADKFSSTTSGVNIIFVINDGTNEIMTELIDNINYVFTRISPGSNNVQIGDGTTTAGNGMTTSGITSIVLPTAFTGGFTVTRIGNYAFAEITSITAIVIPTSVTSIEEHAFYQCANLAFVTFDTGSILETIGKAVFQETAIAVIVIPATVESIGVKAFYLCASLASVTFDADSILETIMQEAFKGTAITAIVIPTSVTSINDDAFYQCANLASVSISSSDTTNIGTNAFASMANAVEVTLRNISTATELNNWKGTSPSYSDNFPASSSGTVVFITNGGILTESESVTNIGYVFTVIDAANKYVQIGDGTTTNGNGTTTTPPTTITIPTTFTGGYTVKQIGTSAFQDRLLTNVILPNTVTIGTNAFVNIGDTTPPKITVPATTTAGLAVYIDDLNFSGANSMPVVFSTPSGIMIEQGSIYVFTIISGTNVRIGTGGGSNAAVGNGMRTQPSSTETIEIPVIFRNGFYNVKEIGQKAFEGYTISRVVLPSSIEKIKADAFKNVTDITSIHIPYTTVIDNYAFSYMNTHTLVVTVTKLTETSQYTTWKNTNTGINIFKFSVVDGTITYQEGIQIQYYRITVNDATVVKITGTNVNSSLTGHIYIDNTYEGYPVTTIGENAFSSSHITSISLPSTLTSIANNAFKDISELTTVTYRGGGASLVSIGDKAFQNTSLATFTVPANMVSIGNNAFQNTSIISVTVPASMTSIGNYAFSGITTLVTLYFDSRSQDIISIGDYAFQNTSLTAITLPEQVTTIGSNAFADSANLREINIYESTHIGTDSFKGMPATSIVIVRGLTTKPELDEWKTLYEDNFTSNTGTVKYVVEHGYIMARAINDIAYIVSVIGVTETIRIGDGSNVSGNGLVFPVSSDITIPTSIILHVDSQIKQYTVTKIGRDAFSNTGITGVTIPEEIEEIGSNAFYNTSLTSLTFEGYVFPDLTSSSNLHTIGAYAFRNAFQGTSIGIPLNVTTIGQGAFRDNPTLKQVVLNGLTTLGGNAFKGMGSKPRVSVRNMEDLLALSYWRGPNEAKFSTVDHSDIRFIPYYQGISSNVCFLAGSLLVTDQGLVNIEKLRIKHHTFNGEQIVAVTRTIAEDECLIQFEVGSLSTGVPTIPTRMSCAHAVMYEGSMIPAVTLVSLEGVSKIPYTRGTPLYNVLLNNHSKMMINNMCVETLHPNNGVAKLTRALLETKDEGDCAEMIFNYNTRASELGIFTNIKHKL